MSDIIERYPSWKGGEMKQLHRELRATEEPRRGRKVYDQKIYVSAFERGTRDRSPRPRRIEPLPDRIELKICPQQNHRGRMKYYRARSIPELCRVTLKPTGEKSAQQGRMEEVYITQYTHCFEQKIEKPHVVAWKRAFEDGDVTHRDSKLCIVNSPVGSKRGGFPERRRSAPPGSFVFDYDALDMPQPVHRRSNSLGMFMDNMDDFDTVDAQMGESAGGSLRPLADEKISAQRVEQVEGVDSSFWDEAFNSFDGEYNSTTNNGFRKDDVRDYDSTTNGDVTNDDVITRDVTTGDVIENGFARYGIQYGDVTHGTPGRSTRDVTTDDVIENGFARRDCRIKYDDVTHGTPDQSTGDVTTDDVIGNRFARHGYRMKYDDVTHGTPGQNTRDVTTDDVIENGFARHGYSIQYGDVTHDTAGRSTQDLTTQARSLISTLRSSVRKPDSKTFLRSLHEPRRDEAEPESNNMMNSSSPKNHPRDPTFQEFETRGFSYRNTAPPETLLPQKVEPRLVSNPRQEFAYQSVRQHEALSRNTLPQEPTSRKTLPREILSRKISPQEDSPWEQSPQEVSPNDVGSHQIVPRIILPQEDLPGEFLPEEVSTQEYVPWRISPQRVSQQRLPHDETPTNALPMTYYPSMTNDPPIINGSIAANDPSISHNPLKPNYSPQPNYSNDAFIPNNASVPDYRSKTDDLLKPNYPSMTNDSSKSIYLPMINDQSITEDQMHKSSDEASFVQPTTNREDISPNRKKSSKLNIYLQRRSVINRENHQGRTTELSHEKPLPDVPTETNPEVEDLGSSTDGATKDTRFDMEVKQELTGTNYDVKLLPNGHPNVIVETIHREERSSLLRDPSYDDDYEDVELKTSPYDSRPKEVEEIVYRSKSIERPTLYLEEDYYQQPSPGLNSTKTSEPSHSLYPQQVDKKIHQSDSRSSIPERPTLDLDEDYYQQPRLELNAMKTTKPSHSLQPQQVDKKIHQNDSRSSIPERPTLDLDEDHYQRPRPELDAMKTTKPSHSLHRQQVDKKIHQNNSRSSIPERPTLDLDEDYYQRPRPELNAMKITKTGYPIRSSSMENQAPKQVTLHHKNDQRPKLEFQTRTTATYEAPVEPTTKESLCGEPKHTRISLPKCPLDQLDTARNHNPDDYEKPVLGISPTVQQDVGENYYEVPNDAKISSTKCPLDQRIDDADYYEQPIAEVEHVYEEPRFDNERVYEQFNYEVMKPSQAKHETDFAFFELPKTRTEMVYEQPKALVGRNVYENLKDIGTRPSPGALERKVDETLVRDETEQVYEEPKTNVESSSPYPAPEEFRNENPLPETLKQKENFESTDEDPNKRYFTVPSTKTQENPARSVTNGSLRTTVKYGEITRPKNGQTDKKQALSTSVGLNKGSSENFNRQKARVRYAGEVSTKKSIVSSTSSLRVDQSDGRMSEGSPKPISSRSASSEGDQLPQQPEAEILNTTRSAKPARKKSKDEDFSQPSIYSKTNSHGNTSLARFSSFNSEASYKRRLTSAWIEQQRINFKKSVSREPSLRRTRSVELLKEPKATDENEERKLKHSKSELSFEQLNAMYDPFNEKYFESNPNKHKAKVLHISEPTVITKAKSLEGRARKMEQPLLQMDASPADTFKENSGMTEIEDGILHRRPGVEQHTLSTEAGQDLVNDEVKQKKQSSSSSQRPRTAKVSAFDVLSSKDEPTLSQHSRNEPSEDKQDEMRANIEGKQKMSSGFSQRSRVRAKSADVSGFDVSTYKDEPTHKHSKNEPTEDKRDEMRTNIEENENRSSGFSQKPRSRPKSADVSGFDVSTYKDEPTQHSRNELNEDRRDDMTTDIDPKRKKIISGSVQRSRVRPKSLDVSGFDVSTYKDEPRPSREEPSKDKRDEMVTSTEGKEKKTPSGSIQRSRVRPKSADVSGFDVSTYKDEPWLSMNEPNEDKRDDMMANTEDKQKKQAFISSQKPRVRPKSADVSQFDVSTYKDEPTLKHSKSELGVDQLKAMYDPYDESPWFSTDAASDSVHQSDSRQVHVTVHEVPHRRTRSEPEKRPAIFGQLKSPEAEVAKVEADHLARSITKLDSSSVLLLNVVEVGENGERRVPQLKQEITSSSASNLVSVTAAEVHNDKHFASTEKTNTTGEPLRNAKESDVDRKPVKLRARYITGGERASVRYLSKSTDELASNEKTTVDEQGASQPQAQQREKPSKAAKKDGGIRTFFGKLRKAKSEPNLDKNFDILDIDSKEGGKKNSEKPRDHGTKFQETSPRDYQEKVSKSAGLKASALYPKFKNFKKNFSKSKQTKADRSLTDSDADFSGKDVSRSEEFSERSVFSESEIKRGTVELTESQDRIDSGVQNQSSKGKSTESIEISQSYNPTKSAQSFSSVTEVQGNGEQPSDAKNRKVKTPSPTSPVLSPRSLRKRFFKSENRVTPDPVSNGKNEKELSTSEGKIAPVVAMSSQENLGRENRGTVEDVTVFVQAKSPEISTSNDGSSNISGKADLPRMPDTTVSSSQARLHSNSKSLEDIRGKVTQSNEGSHQVVASQERPTSYQFGEVISSIGERETINDLNSVEFGGTSSYTGRELAKPSTTDKAYYEKQSSPVELRGNADPGLNNRFEAMGVHKKEGTENATHITNTSYITTTTSLASKEIRSFAESKNSYLNKEEQSLLREDSINNDRQTRRNDVGFNNKLEDAPQNKSLTKQRDLLTEDSKPVSNGRHVETKSVAIENNQENIESFVGNDDVNSKEMVSRKSESEPEVVSPKTKRRAFFGTRIFTSVGKRHFFQNRSDSDRNVEASEDSGNKETTETENSKVEPRMKDDEETVENEALRTEEGLNLSQASRKEENDETAKVTGKISKKKEQKDADDGNEVSKKKGENRSDVSSKKDDKEKHEFGTKIKGFITKVLPQKTSKDVALKDETANGKRTGTELESSLDENNNSTTLLSTKEQSESRTKEVEQRGTNSYRKTTFVVKHLGESDSERSRMSEDEGKKIKHATRDPNSSIPSGNEQRTSYVSKVKHLGDSNTVKTESFEKLAERETSFDDKRFATQGSRLMQQDGAKSEPDFRDETISKTEVVDDVEAFDVLLDFFNTELDEQENKNDKDFSIDETLSSPEKLEKAKRANNTVMTSNGTAYHGKNDGSAKEKDFRVEEHEMQFATDYKTKQSFAVSNNRGEKATETAEFHVNASEEHRGSSSNDSRDIIEYSGYGKATLDRETSKSLEQIKGFTIKHTKTSSLVLSKSMEDRMDAVGRDDVDNGGIEDVTDSSKDGELELQQANSSNHSVVKSTTFVNNTTESSKVSHDKEHAHDVEPKHGTTAFLVNHEDINKKQQLNYIEKVMISVHRGASDVGKLVRESDVTSNVETSTFASLPVSESVGRVRLGSGEGNGTVKFVRSSLGEDSGISRHEKQQKRVLNVDKDWSQVVKEFDTRNNEGTTKNLKHGENVLNENSHELLELVEDDINVEESEHLLQPEDSSTPKQDDTVEMQRIHDGPSFALRGSLNGGINGSHSLIHTTRKSSEASDDNQGNTSFRTSTNDTTEPFISTTQSPGLISESFVNTDERKSKAPKSISNTPSLTRNQDTSFTSKSEVENTVVTIAHSDPKPKLQTQSVGRRSLNRPKSLLNKYSTDSKTVVSKSLENVSNETTVFKDGRNLSTTLVSKQKTKEKPAVLPKPKRNKGTMGVNNGQTAVSLDRNGKQASRIKEVKHKGSLEQRSHGFMDVDNAANLSFVNFRSFQETSHFKGRENYKASESTWEQRKKEGMGGSGMAKSGSIEQVKTEEKNERFDKKDTSLKETGKKLKRKGTTASETSEDLTIRLQRLLCGDESMSEPDDSSVTHEVSSAIYSFSEDSEFDANAIERRFRSLERPKKSPATMRVQRSTHVSIDDSSDEEIFRANNKLDYKIHSKTL